MPSLTRPREPTNTSSSTGAASRSFARAATVGHSRATTILAATALALLGACGRDTPSGPGPGPSPSPTPGLPGATPGPATGPTSIALVAADPPLGATVTGCAAATECAGRIRQTFRLAPSGTGTVLWAVAFLHAPDKTACLQGRTAGFALRAGEAREVEVVFGTADPSDRCRTPLDLTDLALTLEGTVEVGSRQEWALRYRLEP